MNYIRHYYVDNSYTYKDGYWGANFGGNLRTESRSEHIADADGTMELVKFAFTDKSLEPVVLVNWRAHPDNVGASDNRLSPDYVGALRYRMENNKDLTGGSNYRVSFIQGASGNINANSALSGENTWYNKTPEAELKGNTIGKSKSPFVKYGYLLAEAALSNRVSWSEVSGKIRTLRTRYSNDCNAFTDKEVAAAQYVKNNNIKNFPRYYNGATIETSYHRDKILEYGAGGKQLATELNTILIGDSLSFVTAPGELFDRYDSKGSVDVDSQDTGWSSLNSLGYGEPIVMGYTNGDMGYIPNTASYNYNKNVSSYAGIGSYEAQTSAFRQGIGEKLISDYKKMFSWIKGMTVECQHCKEPVTFEAFAQGSYGNAWGEPLEGGHYFLTEDVTSTYLKVLSNTQVCLHLNGKTLKTEDNYTSSLLVVGDEKDFSNAVLSVMDHPENLGALRTPNRITVRGTLNLYGGSVVNAATSSSDTSQTFYVTGGTLNQHGGTIYGGKTTGNGGAIRFWNGSFNMSGGRLEGGEAVNGGAIFIGAGADSSCVVNLSGGTITSGTATTGNCIYHSGGEKNKLQISGNANVDGVYIATYHANNLYLANTFSGAITDGITFADKNMSRGTVLGTAKSGSQMKSEVVVKGKNSTTNTFYLDVQGTQLIATTENPYNIVGSIIDAAGKETVYKAAQNKTDAQVFADILAAYRDTDAYIKLNKPVAVPTLTKNINLDLNGQKNVTVAGTGNYTLYVMDSANDTYDSDNCGTLTLTGTGNIQGMPLENSVLETKGDYFSAGYLKVAAGANTYTFHRVDVGIDAVDTSPSKAGISYACGLYGDDVVEAQVVQFGIAVSIKGDPKEGNDSQKTTLTGFEAGSDGNSGRSSYIRDIMKESNGYVVNKRNAATDIHGRAYIELKGEKYLFGPEVTTNLQEAFEDVNENWVSNNPASKATYELYAKFKSVMNTWDIDKIIAGAKAQG